MKLVKDTGNKGIIQVKKNQRGLLATCQRLTNTFKAVDSHTNRSKGHNRIEKRKASIHVNREYLSRRLGIDWTDHIACIVRIERERKYFDTKRKKWVKSFEVAHYVSTHLVTAKEANKLVRDHWRIENVDHYVRDVAMEEDKSRIRVNPENLSKLRSLALNVLRLNGEKNISNALYKNALNLDRVLNYKFLLD